jgi:putative ABC transport system permease protein
VLTPSVIASDLRQAVRQVGARPGFSALVIMLLALGIGATTAMFSLTDAVLFRSLPIAEPDRVVRIFRIDTAGRPSGNVSHPVFADLRERAASFSQVAAYVGWAPFNLSRADSEPVRLVGSVVTGDYFNLLGVAPLLGRPLLPADDVERGAHPVLVISEQTWRRHFDADPDIVGREVRINTHPFTVVGVMPARFGGLSASAYVDAWASMAMLEQAHPGQSWDALSQRGWTWHDSVARLAPGVSLAQARAEVAAIGAALVEEHGENPDFLRIGLLPADAAAVDTYGRQGTRRNAWLLLGVTFVLLLIAAFNSASLLLVRTEERVRELALRLGIGASRGRVLGMLFMEALLYAALGSTLGLLLAWLAMAAALPALRGVLGAGPVDPLLLLHGRVLVLALALTLGTALIAVLSPALRLFRIDPGQGLKQGALGAPQQRGRVRFVFSAGQVALAVGLLAVALLLARSFWHTAAVDPGFDPRHILVAAIDPLHGGHSPEASADLQQALMERLQAHPAVESVAFAAIVPMQGWQMVASLARPGHEADARSDAEFNVVSSGYLELMRIPLLQGRGFDSGDRAGAPGAMVVNRSFAEHFFPGESALGQEVEMAEVKWQVVGVAADSRLGNLRETIPPAVWMPIAQRPHAMASVLIRSRGADPWTLLPVLREAVHALDPNLPVLRPRSMIEQIGASYAQARVLALLLLAFAALAVLLSTAGLYGLLRWQVRARTREIGIRLAIGASASDIGRSFLWRAILLTAIGIPLGLAGAVLVARLLDGLLFGVSPYDSVSLLAVGFSFLLLVVLATWVPARGASRVDPLAALRHD